MCWSVARKCVTVQIIGDMATIKQYPHFLFSVNSEIESEQDEKGAWSDSEPSNIFLSSCREETDGRGTEIKVADGTFRKITSLIQLPKGSPKVELGTTVFVTNDPDGMDVRIKGVVLKFDQGQLHSRLWV